MTTITERLEFLRKEMKAESIDAIIFPSTDPHNSEYVAEHWQARKWISGFTGSAGTAVVTQDDAALWTDSRYFLQAAEQLKDTGFTLMKEGLQETPDIVDWLKQKMSVIDGRCVAVDGMVMNYADIMNLQQQMRRIGVSVRTNYDAMRMIWRDRPAIPTGEIYVHPLEYAGESVKDKLQRIIAIMDEQHCVAHITTDLMNIAWTLNLRGCDVPCTPVFMAFLYISRQETVLFANPSSLTDEAKKQLRDAYVDVMEYGAFSDFVSKRANEGKIMCDSRSTCFNIYNKVKDVAVDIPSPIAMMKAIKNETEIEGFRRSMKRDAIAMKAFLEWLKPAVESGGVTELTVSDKLRELRCRDKAFRDVSFDTIAGYNAHGAIVHYHVTEESNAELKPEGLLLVDSGAQYEDGTTDITRTIALGPLTDEMCYAYTTVLKAHIALATLKFPLGATGTNIDAVARSVVWRAGMNYLHGTGHGVGACLSVHEGPQSIRLDWRETPLMPGMVVTNEPGVYLADRFGVRIENTMLVVKDSENEFGTFLRLEPLTICPIDTTPIVWDMLTEEEKNYLTAYNNRCMED